MTVLRNLLPVLALPGLLCGQQVAKVDPAAGERIGPPERGAADASVTTRIDARTITLTIPAPRGLVTDRYGKPLAQNKVGYQFALNFDHLKNPTDEVILEWARKRVGHAEALAGVEWSVSDTLLLEHYRNRRWLPLPFSSLLEEAKLTQFRTKLLPGMILHPFYYRVYPQHRSAAHIIGYVRSKGKLPTDPIVHGDLLFEDTSGEAGLEQTLDTELTGQPGERKIIFDSGGKKLFDKQTRRPRIGNTVVTTLNLKWQKHAESVLQRSCKRGAFVVIDIQTGEVLVLASRPSYDVNVWIPRISQEDLTALDEDESKPMFARAYQGQYPPASSFKPVVALTAMTNNVVREWTKINCPAKIKIGDKWFRNHSRYPEGRIDVAKALARSNNCWFYQVGMKTGPNAFLSVASRLGFGSRTGLPLFAEAPGRIPTDEYVRKKFGRPFTDGDTANYSIGQAWEATPLQVAQAMAGIANGSVLPRLHLIKQVQDPAGGVLRVAEPEARNTLTLDPDAVEVVHKGMMQVVHAGYGTGKRGALSFTRIAAKTGTAQWIANRELAWFAGFFPYENPRLAFAVLYEGSKGESVSGGKKAAPMVPRFFQPLKQEIKDMIKPAAKALIVEEDPIVVPEVVPPEDLATDPDGKLVKPSGKILRALPVEPLAGEKEPGEEDEESPEETPPDIAGDDIIVDDAPVAIPVEEDPAPDPEESDGEKDEVEEQEKDKNQEEDPEE